MKEEHSKILLQWMVPIVLFIGLLAVMFFNFFTKIKLEGVLANESDMLSVAEEYGEKVHSDLQTMKVAGKTASAILAEDEGNEAALEAAMSALLMNTNAYEVVYHQGSGVGDQTDRKGYEKYAPVDRSGCHIRSSDGREERECEQDVKVSERVEFEIWVRQSEDGSRKSDP